MHEFSTLTARERWLLFVVVGLLELGLRIAEILLGIKKGVKCIPFVG